MALVINAPFADASSSRAWTPQDLPDDFKLAWYHFPDASTVTLDANGKIASIANKFNNGLVMPAQTANANRRSSIVKLNGFDTSYQADYYADGLLVTNMAAFPTGSADRFFVWAVGNGNSNGGIIGGYRKSDTNSEQNQFWIDSNFYLRAGDTHDGGNGVDRTLLNTLLVNYKEKVMVLRANGVQKSSKNATLSGSYPYFGLRAAAVDYYNMAGSVLGGIWGKRAATQDEMWRIEWYYSTFGTVALPADNPYKTRPPTVAF